MYFTRCSRERLILLNKFVLYCNRGDEKKNQTTNWPRLYSDIFFLIPAAAAAANAQRAGLFFVVFPYFSLVFFFAYTSSVRTVFYGFGRNGKIGDVAMHNAREYVSRSIVGGPTNANNAREPGESHQSKTYVLSSKIVHQPPPGRQEPDWRARTRTMFSRTPTPLPATGVSASHVGCPRRAPGDDDERSAFINGSPFEKFRTFFFFFYEPIDDASG